MQYHEIGKTGMKVSSLSFGASSLGGVFHDLKEKEGIQAVFTAIEAGDCSRQSAEGYSSRPLLSFYESRTLWQRRSQYMGLLGKACDGECI